MTSVHEKLQELENLREKQKNLEKSILELKKKQKIYENPHIQRADSLIYDISSILDFKYPNQTEKTHRENMNYIRNTRIQSNNKNIQASSQGTQVLIPPRLPLKDTHLVNEEIFVALLDVIKHQEERIINLETKISYFTN